MDTVWYDYDKVNKEDGTAIAIGNFDGLHLGHMEIMNTLKKVSKEHSLKSVCYTFESHPVNIIKGKNALKLIADNSQKEELVASCNIDTLFFEDFLAVKDIPAKDFVKEILVDKLNMKVVVVGLHNHYGKNSEGDIKLLRELGQKYGFLVYMVKLLYIDDVMCSSTKVREYISGGEIEKANKILGRNFKIAGTVVKHKELGKTIGFPTANIMPKSDMLMPQKAVYATSCRVGEKIYKSITNVGDCPTVDDNTVSFETHIIDFAEDIYGEEIIVDFHNKMREITHFDSVDGLIGQLKNDVDIRKRMEYTNEYSCNR